ncbi:MAG: rod shape-determining protein MreC [Firmicutes bacterium]|nr:rod shape-determining protein MreC [Bacillota bacterium]
MHQFIVSRRIWGYIVIFFLLVSIIYVTARERGRLTFAEEMICEALRPLLSFFSEIASYVNRAVWTVGHIGQLRRENLELAREVAKLNAELMQLSEYKAENERLKQLLGFKEAAPYNTVAARVIGRDPSRITSSLILDKGKRDGVRKDMPVIYLGGLVGRVISVTPSTSTVLPIIDPKSAVGGIVHRTRDLALVEGQSQETALCRLKPLSSDADLRVGDQIISSGLGGIFPKGLLIGTIIDVSAGKYLVGKNALVKPDVDFAKLEEVLVITSKVLPSAEGDIKGGTSSSSGQ